MDTNIVFAKNKIEEIGYLDIDIDASLDPFYQIERLKKEKAHRPLIKNLSDEELYNFLSNKLKERFPNYSQAQYHLKGNKISDVSFAEILKKIHE